MKKVLEMPAKVTMIPIVRRAMTARRCLIGRCRFQMIGRGSRVHSRSQKQLVIPADSVTVPSFKQVEPGIIGKTQYDSTGL